MLREGWASMRCTQWGEFYVFFVFVCVCVDIWEGWKGRSGASGWKGRTLEFSIRHERGWWCQRWMKNARQDTSPLRTHQGLGAETIISLTVESYTYGREKREAISTLERANVRTYITLWVTRRREKQMQRFRINICFDISWEKGRYFWFFEDAGVRERIVSTPQYLWKSLRYFVELYKCGIFTRVWK